MSATSASVRPTKGKAKAKQRSPVRFAPINQLRAHEYVAEQIRRHIALRLIPPGESLPAERELAAMFGVGRPTLQHALRLLEADRLVDTRRGRHGGTFVAKAKEDEHAMEELIARVRRDHRELGEMLVYRRALEPAVARAAARARRNADVTAMRRAAAAMRESETEDDYMRRDNEFHLAVAAATRNRFFARAVEDMRVRLNDAIALLPESDVWHRRIDEEHELITEAIDARDEDAAEAAMRVHVANAEQGLRAVLNAVRRRPPS
jgi:GntR family transcriptional regulator, transcriptional repressor for pyruvate dehydrogenase complex